MEWKRWGFSHPTKEFLNNPDLQEKYKEKYKQFKKYRSEVIEAALEIENLLTIVLLHFLVGQDYSRHKLLRSFVFDAEFCTFMQKRKMLSLLYEMFPNSFDFFTQDESKKLRKYINDIITERNKYAHGNIFIDTRNGDAFIEYYQGRQKREEIDENKIHDIIKKCELIDNMLSELNEFLKKHKLELPEENK